MNNPSLESYFNVLYEFLRFTKESRDIFAGNSSFSVILGNFAQWHHSTPFDTIPQDVQNQIRKFPHMLVLVLR